MSDELSLCGQARGRQFAEFSKNFQKNWQAPVAPMHYGIQERRYRAPAFWYCRGNLPSNSDRVVHMLVEPEELADDRLLHDYVQSQNHEAFAALVRRYSPMVWAVCRRIAGHTQDAEDAFQATFAILVRKAPSIRRQRAIGAWLHEVARRTAVRARAASNRREKSLTALVEDVPARSAPDEAAREQSQILDGEINRLPERLRLPIILCYLQGLTNREAAQRIGCPEGTIVSRLARARERLRRRLVRRGLVLTGAAAVTTLLIQAGSAASALPASLEAALDAAFAASPAGLTTAATTGAILSATSVQLANETARSLARRRFLKWLGGLVGAACAVGLCLAIPLLTRDSMRTFEGRLQGRWELQKMDVGGMNWPFDPQRRHDVIFTNHDFVLYHVDGGQEMQLRGTFQLDPAQPVRFIDMRIGGEGPPALCLYEIEGTRLRLAMTDPGAARPPSLAPDPSQPVMLFVFER
jgi:RNA polymerase sigma factor (sigma-70 family)